MIYFQSILTGVAKFIHIFLDLPFHSPKSLVVCCGIINNANQVPLVNHPPTIISMLIKKTPKHLLTSNTCSEPKILYPLLDWRSQISYVGSSMLLFQNWTDDGNYNYLFWNDSATVSVICNVNGYYFWNDTYNWYNQGSGLAPVMVMITITKLKLNLKCNIPVLVTSFQR